jgi:hypothetical protein
MGYQVSRVDWVFPRFLRQEFNWVQRSGQRTTPAGRRASILSRKPGLSTSPTGPPGAPHDGEDPPLVFWADNTPDKPCDYKLITRGLYQALAQIGIDESERRQRHLSFHSWRH